jgi:hypothetical protein
VVDGHKQALHASVIGIIQNALIDISYRRMMNDLWLLRLDRKLNSPNILRTLRATGDPDHLHPPRCRGGRCSFANPSSNGFPAQYWLH